MSNFDLASYTVDSGGIPQAYYIPDFVSEYEEEYLLRQIYSAPKLKWKNLGNRRLQVWGGDLTASNKLLAQALPPFLTEYPDIIGKLQSTGVFSKSKHKEFAKPPLLHPKYLPLQGIMPHEDGPSYHPVVATISLGSHTVFHYYRYKPDAPPATLTTDATPLGQAHEVTGFNQMGGGRVIDMSRPVLSLLLEPRSLVITTGELYTGHLHGIGALAEDTFVPAQSKSESELVISDSASHASSVDGSRNGVHVANWKMIKDEHMREIVMNGGTLKRRDRISLTCRDVEDTVSIKAFR